MKCLIAMLLKSLGEGTEREIDPSLPRPSSGSVGASCRSTLFFPSLRVG